MFSRIFKFNSENVRRTTMDSLQALCEKCNLGKSNKLDDEN